MFKRVAMITLGLAVCSSAMKRRRLVNDTISKPMDVFRGGKWITIPKKERREAAKNKNEIYKSYKLLMKMPLGRQILKGPSWAYRIGYNKDDNITWMKSAWKNRAQLTKDPEALKSVSGDLEELLLSALEHGLEQDRISPFPKYCMDICYDMVDVSKDAQRRFGPDRQYAVEVQGANGMDTTTLKSIPLIVFPGEKYGPGMPYDFCRIVNDPAGWETILKFHNGDWVMANVKAFFSVAKKYAQGYKPDVLKNLFDEANLRYKKNNVESHNKPIQKPLTVWKITKGPYKGKFATQARYIAPTRRRAAICHADPRGDISGPQNLLCHDVVDVSMMELEKEYVPQSPVQAVDPVQELEDPQDEYPLIPDFAPGVIVKFRNSSHYKMPMYKNKFKFGVLKQYSNTRHAWYLDLYNAKGTFIRTGREEVQHMLVVQ